MHASCVQLLWVRRRKRRAIGLLPPPLISHADVLTGRCLVSLLLCAAHRRGVEGLRLAEYGSQATPSPVLEAGLFSCGLSELGLPRLASTSSEVTNANVQSTVRLSVWIGCLACYNSGRLVGEWCEAEDAGYVTPDDLHGAPPIMRNCGALIMRASPPEPARSRLTRLPCGASCAARLARSSGALSRRG